jgi:hypothetical protein
VGATPDLSTRKVLPSGEPIWASADLCFSIQSFHAWMPSLSFAFRVASSSAFQPAIESGVPRKMAR